MKSRPLPAAPLPPAPPLPRPKPRGDAWSPRPPPLAPRRSRAASAAARRARQQRAPGEALDAGERVAALGGGGLDGGRGTPGREAVDGGVVGGGR